MKKQDSYSTIHHAFELQVQKTPNDLAIYHNGKSITYSELNGMANQLAHYLHTHATDALRGEEPRIGLCVGNGIYQMVGLFGILKAGAAYIPFDPIPPQEWLSFIIKDSEMDLILTDNDFIEKNPQFYQSHSDKKMIHLQADLTEIQKMSHENPNLPIHSSHLAYIIYTSGSTGNPKGVLIEHGAVVNCISSEKDYCITPQSRFLQFASISFDAAGWDIYGALFHGCPLFIPDYRTKMSPNELHQFIYDHRLTVICLTPTMLSLLPKTELPELKTIFVIGDSSDCTTLNYWKKNRQLFIGYGPTETTIGATIYPYQENDPPTKIGRPLKNYKVYILDQENQILPMGEKGELCIAGIGVARQYLNSPELTKKRFVPNPFDDDENFSRMYRTGDLAQWLPDNNLEFLGRMDDQIKIHGVRIQLSRIEALLLTHPEVAQCAVIHCEDRENSFLAAYWSAKNPTTALDNAQQLFQKYLKKYLPPAAIPSLFILVKSFDLTISGKIDKQKLKKSIFTIPFVKDGPLMNQDEIEKILTKIFAESLEMEDFTVQDNFFALGGDSLAVMQMALKIKSTFNLDYGAREIFENPSISELTKLIMKKNLLC